MSLYTLNITCPRCHFKADTHPVEFSEFVAERDRLRALLERAERAIGALAGRVEILAESPFRRQALDLGNELLADIRKELGK